MVQCFPPPFLEKPDAEMVWKIKSTDASRALMCLRGEEGIICIERSFLENWLLTEIGCLVAVIFPDCAVPGSELQQIRLPIIHIERKTPTGGRRHPFPSGKKIFARPRFCFHCPEWEPWSRAKVRGFLNATVNLPAKLSTLYLLWPHHCLKDVFEGACKWSGKQLQRQDSKGRP